MNMNLEFEQLGRIIVNRTLEQQDFTVNELPVTEYANFHASHNLNGNQFCVVVRTQPVTQIDNFTYYHLNKKFFEGVVVRNNKPYPTRIYFVDLQFSRLAWADVESLNMHCTHTAEQNPATIKINNDIYFPLADFTVTFFKVSEFFKTTPEDESTAARIIKELHRKKISAMQTEFEKMINSLLMR